MPAKQQQTAEPVQQERTNEQTAVLSGSRIPTIGRIVHFVMPDGSQRPAIVTKVLGTEGHGDLGVNRETEGAAICDLVVFTTAEEHGAYGAAYGVGNVAYDAAGAQGNTWHWHNDPDQQGTRQGAWTGPETAAGSSVGSSTRSAS